MPKKGYKQTPQHVQRRIAAMMDGSTYAERRDRMREARKALGSGVTSKRRWREWSQKRRKKSCP